MRVVLARNDNAVASKLLQSRFWAEFKSLSGWSYSRYEVSVPDTASTVFALSVLERGLGAGSRFAYVPHGPDAQVKPGDETALLAALSKELKPLVSPQCMFIRFDPAWHTAAPCAASEGSKSTPERPCFGAPLIKASDVQPPDSVVLDIGRTDDELLAGMKPKWRYNVRLAEKKGVTVADEGIKALDEFYTLYQATAERDRIGIHPKDYYAQLMGLEHRNPKEPKPDLRLWIARFEGKALAAIMTVFHGSEATYLYGASSDEHRNLMPAYALQWAAMRAARDAGCSSYDFYGIPPVDDPAHAMSGLYRFKTGFGGEIRHYAGAWDFVLKPAVYTAFRVAERARLFWHKSVRKKLAR
jgi:lipid II:glycine glycyltransferase (peptidoglycan interpeptide bridge formation enzyme)